MLTVGANEQQRQSGMALAGLSTAAHVPALVQVTLTLGAGLTNHVLSTYMLYMLYIHVVGYTSVKKIALFVRDHINHLYGTFYEF